MIPNLNVEHLSPIALARLSDVRAAIIDRPYDYEIARRKLGLSSSQYAEFVQDLSNGDATYAILPRHIDAMSGRRRSGSVYVLHHVLIPPQIAGWIVSLHDGTLIFVPRICGNLSMSAGTPKRTTKTAMTYKGYFQKVTFAPAAAPVTPQLPYVDTPPNVPVAAPIQPAAGKFAFGWLAPLIVPIISAFDNPKPSKPPVVAKCSLGSNEVGTCQE